MSRAGRKGATKFSSTGGKAPGYHSYRTISKRPSECWLPIGHKKCFIIVPNRRTVSPEFFSWVHTRLLFSRHTCPVRSSSLCVQGKLLFSTFRTRKEVRNYRSMSQKPLGCYQQELFSLLREYPVFDGSQCIVNNRKFKMRRRRESQISNSLTRQNNNFAPASHFFVHFFAVNCTTTLENGKCLFSCFVKDVNKQWQNSFSSWTWIWLIEIKLQKSALTFDKVSELE